MKESQDLVPWREIGRVAAMLTVAVAIYTIGVAPASFDQLLGWLNTLISTMLTVFSALVVGLVLFRFQTRETGRKKREDLAVLLEAELGEPERKFLDYSPVVPGEILEDLRPSAFHDVRLNIPPARDRGGGTQWPVWRETDSRDAQPLARLLRHWSPTWTGPGLVVRMVQLSEESIVAGRGEVLERLGRTPGR